ncbi:MAG: phosphatidate cytidylyltransferase [Armatimonadota bacterium]|nr:phosphatidate cytidylyltransferase [Armatimonadota bacterium]MDR7451578.1 phosphatidate cytidylyltransferase [Armatimonadota bacterium]MDR7467702.1 phosphatidate cytidylyltransferase [Armatimonadota bacterium]MDR7492547.1 phosphatidate cytidylyltransferase [Armatimonadota bacterium]MDR7500579.1 phosphatidate cytidylyltransferase [Armatimonadota bacterium]
MDETLSDRFRRASLRMRILTAAAGIPVVVIALWLGGRWWTGMVVLVALLGWHEFVRLHRLGKGHRAASLVVLAVLFALLLRVSSAVASGVLAVWAAALVADTVPSFRRGRLQSLPPARRTEAFRAAWHAGLGGWYLAVPTAVLARWRSEFPAASVLSFFLVVWATDTAAYFIGVGAGRHRLAPAISPGKSWEGAAAGLAAGALAGFLTAGWWAMPPGRAAVVGALIALASQIGDLAESAMKRKAGVKDAGSLLPGHGGILDRFDGVFVAAPAAYLLARLWGMPR